MSTSPDRRGVKFAAAKSAIVAELIRTRFDRTRAQSQIAPFQTAVEVLPWVVVGTTQERLDEIWLNLFEVNVLAEQVRLTIQIQAQDPLDKPGYRAQELLRVAGFVSAGAGENIGVFLAALADGLVDYVAAAPTDPGDPRLVAAKAAFLAELAVISFDKAKAAAQAGRLQMALNKLPETPPSVAILELPERVWTTLFEGDNVVGLARVTLKVLDNEAYEHQLVIRFLQAARQVSKSARVNIKIAVEALKSALAEYGQDA